MKTMTNSKVKNMINIIMPGNENTHNISNGIYLKNESRVLRSSFNCTQLLTWYQILTAFQ